MTDLQKLASLSRKFSVAASLACEAEMHNAPMYCLAQVDHAIDLWNELINLAPRVLKNEKLSHLK